MRAWIVPLCLMLAMPIVSAKAADQRVDWPTFFRVDPSRHGRVVEELRRGIVVYVRSCDEQWCLVQHGRTLGYVERAALNSEALPSSGATAGADCFDSTRAGYGKGEVLRFCGR